MLDKPLVCYTTHYRKYIVSRADLHSSRLRKGHLATFTDMNARSTDNTHLLGNILLKVKYMPAPVSKHYKSRGDMSVGVHVLLLWSFARVQVYGLNLTLLFNGVKKTLMRINSWNKEILKSGKVIMILTEGSNRNTYRRATGKISDKIDRDPD